MRGKRRVNIDGLRKQLEEVEAQIAEHPPNVQELREFREVMDQSEGKGSKFLKQELAARGLPSPPKAAAMSIQNIRVAARLGRKKRRILRKMNKYS